ncbi:MAG: PEP-CTERM sorting domain-containing protein [Verrucomicrobiota bacterium]
MRCLIVTGLVVTAGLFFHVERAEAQLTNLVTNGDFEGQAAGFIYSATSYEAVYPQWNTQTSNGFQYIAQGGRDAPATFTPGGVATGNTLELRGFDNAGVITLTVDLPSNILTGTNNVTLNFQSFSRGAAYQNTGRFTLTAGATTIFSDATINNTSGNWTANSFAFTAAASDTVVVSWRDSGPTGNTQGLRLDDIQVLATIVAAVPEPGAFGATLLGMLMIWLSWRKRCRFA